MFSREGACIFVIYIRKISIASNILGPRKGKKDIVAHVPLEEKLKGKN